VPHGRCSLHCLLSHFVHVCLQECTHMTSGSFTTSKTLPGSMTSCQRCVRAFVGGWVWVVCGCVKCICANFVWCGFVTATSEQSNVLSRVTRRAGCHKRCKKRCLCFVVRHPGTDVESVAGLETRHPGLL
jgi:hypothetical protein